VLENLIGRKTPTATRAFHFTQISFENIIFHFRPKFLPLTKFISLDFENHLTKHPNATYYLFFLQLYPASVSQTVKAYYRKYGVMVGVMSPKILLR